jgi:5-formyltetrahydrofolate cyclo-ligase
MIKSKLRKSHLARQRALSPVERDAMSTQIANNFFAGFDLTQVNLLHCFVPIEKFNEIDTSYIFHGIWKQFPQIQTVVPRVDFDRGEMDSVRYTAETELEQNRWNIHEPSHDESVEAELIDMVLTPGLAYDRSGHRIGYGKGFYDRFLDLCRPDCVKVGLSYFEPVGEIEDTHEGDVRLDHIVTPEHVLRAFNGSA